ncbi:hypothetical protein [Streptomyces sp. LN704]|uniref:hypothetical protein n=1 Tax=unclassified Streptomyces TaxID=2593676 RepID=UPI003712429F
MGNGDTLITTPLGDRVRAQPVEVPGVVDLVHPAASAAQRQVDATTHRRMGERFARLAFTPGGPLAATGG